MHTFIKKPVSRLSMRRLSEKEIGPFRSEIMDVLARAKDPFASVNYQIDIEPCRQRAKAIGSANKRHITLTPVLIKLIAHIPRSAVSDILNIGFKRVIRIGAVI